MDVKQQAKETFNFNIFGNCELSATGNRYSFAETHSLTYTTNNDFSHPPRVRENIH